METIPRRKWLARRSRPRQAAKRQTRRSGMLFALTTTGIDGFTHVTSWYAEPIVFEKVVLYTMLFEVVGLGCGFGPLNNRFFPPMGSILYIKYATCLSRSACGTRYDGVPDFERMASTM